ncbi:MAG: hypothetical protein IJ575_01285 [Selenomonadaceae bacterium]|nr:hypothetical protein [Selenomonadaceae bacterium]
MEEFFSLLNLPEDASKDEIRRAFHLWKEKQQAKLNRSATSKEASAELIRMTTIYKDIIMGHTKPEFSESKFVKLAKIEKIETDPAPKIEPPVIDTEAVVKSETRLRETLHQLQSIEKIPIQETQEVQQFESRSKRRSENRANRKFASPIVPAAAVILGVLLGNLIFTFAERVEVESYEKEPPKIVTDQKLSSSQDQRDAIQILYSFHDSITQKNFRSAYGYFSPSYQKVINFDGWAAGFKSTVSSSVSNVQVAKDLGDRIVLTYSLATADSPGGNAKFVGTALMVKTQEGWRINEIINIAK